MTSAATNELDGLFQHELASVNEDLRRKAALSAFRKLHPSNRVTVEQFLAGLQHHKEMWAALSTLGILDFAEALVGRRETATAAEPTQRRTRISDDQKSALKSAILRVLEGKSSGMNRIEVTAAIIVGGLAPDGLDRAELPEKLRQPLHELVTEGKLHTTGEKRSLKYLSGGKKGK
jgi:hypothetical protein